MAEFLAHPGIYHEVCRILPIVAVSLLVFADTYWKKKLEKRMEPAGSTDDPVASQASEGDHLNTGLSQRATTTSQKTSFGLMRQAPVLVDFELRLVLVSSLPCSLR